MHKRSCMANVVLTQTLTIIFEPLTMVAFVHCKARILSVAFVH
jgi:hypothetical protein